MTGACNVRVIGSYLSPYVRKVLVCLELKGIAHEIDPIVPFYGNEAFAKVSPRPSLYPQAPALRARARWLEEFADSRFGRVLALEPFQRLKRLEDKLLRTPIAEHRKTLAESGAPLSADSFANESPRRGVMPL